MILLPRAAFFFSFLVGTEKRKVSGRDRTIRWIEPNLTLRPPLPSDLFRHLDPNECRRVPEKKNSKMEFFSRMAKRPGGGKEDERLLAKPEMKRTETLRPRSVRGAPNPVWKKKRTRHVTKTKRKRNDDHKTSNPKRKENATTQKIPRTLFVKRSLRGRIR